MPKQEYPEKGCRMHKIMMGIGIIIFGFVLYMTSSDAALSANLNWPGAFLVVGVLLIIKALAMPMWKK